jgi:hypothetical protein
LKILESVKTEALRGGYTSYELESRLLLGKIELNSEPITSGRSRLKALIKEAQSKNFNLIAREAQTALGPTTHLDSDTSRAKVR